jgi:hypothetical protein
LAAFRRPPESSDGQETGQQHVGDVCNVAIAAATATTPRERLISSATTTAMPGLRSGTLWPRAAGRSNCPIDRERFPYLFRGKKVLSSFARLRE